jgi:uncharacterized protein with ParB-like and HNH nuclease domain
MKAYATSFSFLSNEGKVKIPFFQRAYVWDKVNWSDLLEDLMDFNKNHFLGSLILKQQKKQSGMVKEVLVIDGQQRLTTLSLLLRVLYDSFPEDIQKNCIDSIKNNLWYKQNQTDPIYFIKIEHSHIDAKYYKKIINSGLNVAELEDITEESNKVQRCYKYFIEELQNVPEQTRKMLFDKMSDRQNEILVLIDLEENEDEQSIFDTINSAGVRLTSADIVKNALFQKALELKGTYSEEDIVQLYKENWDNIFSLDVDTRNFWEATRLTGRLTRDNTEILLHSIAVIKDFFNPDIHTLSNLSDLYKEKINSYTDLDSLKTFITEIKEYAKLYREKMYVFDNVSAFSFSDNIKRLFHILSVLEISTFHPFILFLLKKYENNEATLLNKLSSIEKFVMRRMISKQETKSYNKLCKEFILNESILNEKLQLISNDQIIHGLKSITNKNASLVLFWVELFRRMNTPRHDTDELKYNYSLEHIMPQKWEEYWQSVPTKVNSNGTQMTPDEAKKDRYEKIYHIGNMTLLKTSLNTSLRNYTFDRKVIGEGRKKGMKAYATLSITQDDIIIPFETGDTVWDENKIISRTNNLTNEILTLW